MKKMTPFILLATISSISASAQTKHNDTAVKQISTANAQADINNGKKMQQQSLNKPFEKIADTIPISTKKKFKRIKRKHN